MAEQTKQDSQKTIVAFVVGLLIGGMLVWAFSDSPSESEKNSKSDAVTTETKSESDSAKIDVSTDKTPTAEVADTTPTLPVGDGSIVVNDQPAGTSIALDSATYPVGEGWVGVRDLTAGGDLSYILGVVRFSESQGLVPSEIVLQRATTAGKEYAVVVFTEDGDRQFNPRFDTQIDQVYATFTAQ